MLNVCQCAMVVSCLTFALFLAQKSCCQFKISIFQLRALSFGTHNANSNQENTCRTEKHEHYIILFSTIKLDNFHENCWHKFSGVRGAPGDILLTFLKNFFYLLQNLFGIDVPTLQNITKYVPYKTKDHGFLEKIHSAPRPKTWIRYCINLR